MLDVLSFNAAISAKPACEKGAQYQADAGASQSLDVISFDAAISACRRAVGARSSAAILHRCASLMFV